MHRAPATAAAGGGLGKLENAGQAPEFSLIPQSYLDKILVLLPKIDHINQSKNYLPKSATVRAFDELITPSGD